jgi:hypothetical protein
MSSKPAKTLYSFRLPRDLIEWADENLTTDAWDFENRTDMVQGFLEAAREGRLSIRPRGPDPFPAEAVQPGSRPDFPLLFAWPSEPDPLLNEAFPAEVADAE